MLNLIIEKYHLSNKEFFKNIPLRDKQYFEPFIQKDLHCDQITREEKDIFVIKLKEIGNNAATAFINEIREDLKYNIKGHFLHNIKPDVIDKKLSTKYLARGLQFSFGMAILNFEKNRKETEEELIEFLTSQSVVNFDYFDKPNIVLKNDISCSECGEDFSIAIALSDNSIICNSFVSETKECRMPSGIGEYSVNLKVPSGKIVLANRLSSILPEEVQNYADDYMQEHCENDSISNSLGKLTHSQYYEKLGIVYLQTTNGSGNIYYNKSDNVISIKHSYSYKIIDGIEQEVLNQNTNEEDAGFLCMDLWAITAMDYDVFIEYCKSEELNVEETIKNLSITFIDIPKGVYKARNHYEEKEYHECGMYAQFTKIANIQ